MNDMYLFSIPEEKFYVLKQKFTISGDFPEARAHFSMIHIGDGIVSLFGGQDAQG